MQSTRRAVAGQVPTWGPRMTRERFLHQFRAEYPEYESHFDPVANEYGLPLSPSGTYKFLEWIEGSERERILGLDAAAIRESLVQRFGTAVKVGRIGAWDQPANNDVG